MPPRAASIIIEPGEAERIHRLALRGEATPQEATAYRRNLGFEMARMATEDGLTMTLHPGVRRNHHGPTLEAFGGDTGHDLPLEGEFSDGLRPLLEAFGTHPDLTLVLFTLDETTGSRELASLAGFSQPVAEHRLDEDEAVATAVDLVAGRPKERPDLADALAAQDGHYTLVTRDADGDRFEMVDRVAAYPATAHDLWLAEFAGPEAAAVTDHARDLGTR